MGSDGERVEEIEGGRKGGKGGRARLGSGTTAVQLR